MTDVPAEPPRPREPFDQETLERQAQEFARLFGEALRSELDDIVRGERFVEVQPSAGEGQVGTVRETRVTPVERQLRAMAEELRLIRLRLEDIVSAIQELNKHGSG